MTTVPSRDELISSYLDQLPFEPYPVQEEALQFLRRTDIRLNNYNNCRSSITCFPGTEEALRRAMQAHPQHAEIQRLGAELLRKLRRGS